jgi:hypothetical protein
MCEPVYQDDSSGQWSMKNELTPFEIAPRFFRIVEDPSFLLDLSNAKGCC